MEEDIEKMMRRQGQREEFLEELKRVVLDGEEECLSDFTEDISERVKITFYLELSTNLATYLLLREDAPFKIPSDFIRTKIIPMIEEFSPVETERLVLVADLLGYTTGEIRRPFEQRMFRLNMPPERKQFLKEIGFKTEDGSGQ